MPWLTMAKVEPYPPVTKLTSHERKDFPHLGSKARFPFSAGLCACSRNLKGGACRDAKEASYMSKTIAILIARLIFGGIFVMAAASKFSGMEATANHIAEAGFPFPLPLAWVAAVFETLIAIALLTGAYFREAALLAAIYLLFLAFAFHGPSHWNGNRAEFRSFVDHFTFIAGLLFAAVHGAGETWTLGSGVIWKQDERG